MTDPPPSERHLSPQGFADYLSADVPVVLPLAGEPQATIFIDPRRGRIGLRSPIATDASPPPTPLANLHLSIVTVDGSRQLEIASSAIDLFSDVYPMLCAIADRIQLDHNPPLAAVDATLETWARLLARRSRLSDDQEIGLFGELLLLGALVNAWNAADGVESWRGPRSEEHDFGLADVDVEVKTTAGERRKHWIASLTQLVPTAQRPLWLISLQITRAGAGHGQTLPELLDAVRSSLTDEVTLNRFEEVLKSLHWHESQRDLYLRRWQLRSTPRAFRVDRRFPTLTSASLATLGMTSGELTQLRYEIDITHRTPDDPPEPLWTAFSRMA